MARPAGSMIWSILVLSLLGVACGGARGPQAAPSHGLDLDPTLGVREGCQVGHEAVTCPTDVMREHLHGVVSLWDLAMAQARDLEAERALRDVDVAEAVAGRERAESDRERAELLKWSFGLVGFVGGLLAGGAAVLLVR